jgi:pyruvate,water dikinase
MRDSVLPLQEVAGDTAVAGGKGANLGALMSAGFPVPPGFVVSSHAAHGFF